MRQETQKDTIPHISRIATNEEYYNNVFKKTERSVSVIFYILSFISVTKKSEHLVEHLKAKAFLTQEQSLQALTLYTSEVPEGLFAFEQSLVALAGALELAHAGRVINNELHLLVYEEIDAILRYLRNHFGKLAQNQGEATRRAEFGGSPSSSTLRQKPSRVKIPKGDISSDAHLVYSQLTDRGERIKTVLEAKPGATIKDLSEVITDVSEKTIQRELNSLIEKGQVIREGERRWSKYSISR